MAEPGKGIDVLKRGWLIKQGGRVKTWKRRYFILDGAGRLTYYTTDADAESGQNRLGVINIKKALYVTPRNKDTKDASTWPQAVPSEACFTIITNDRNYGIYGETEQEAHNWVKTLQAVRGGVDNAEITALIEDSASERRPSTSSTSSGELVYRRYHMNDEIPVKVKAMFAKWHRVLQKTLKSLSSHFGCPEFSLSCDMGKLYQEAPRPLRNRLGELIFADYVDEMRFNICKELGDDPIAKEAFLAVTSKHKIEFSLSEKASSEAALVSAIDGVLHITVARDMLGKGIHLTGKDFASTIPVLHDKPVCGGKLEGLPLSDALNVARAKERLEATEARLAGALPGKKTVQFECDYKSVHEAARAGSCRELCPCMGDIIIRKILEQVVAKVVDQLAVASPEAKDRFAGVEEDIVTVFKLDGNEKAATSVMFASSGTQLVISCGLERMREMVLYDRNPQFDLSNLLNETADFV